MATSIILPSGKSTNLPGAYSFITSGIKNPALALAYGNVLIIDTSSSVGKGGLFGGGAGVNGTLNSGKNALYTFTSNSDFRSFINGGLWWLLASPIFSPGGGATAGASSVSYIRAKTTTPATIDLVFGATDDSDSDLDPTNDGTLTVQVRQEGYVGNGVLGDEVRAQATITITNAGSVGNIIAVVIDGETVATHTRITGDTIQSIVTALVVSAQSIGLVDVVSSSASQLVIYGIRGYADDLNSVTPTISVTGTIAGSSGSFSGGIEGTKLTRGYAARVTTGISDTTKYLVQFFKGTFKGTDDAISNGTPYDGLSELSTKAQLIVQSPEVSTVQQLKTWMQDTTGAGYAFNQYFYLSTSSIASTDIILPQDLTVYTKAVGGSESGSIDDLQDALEAITDQNWDFIIADQWGDNARSTYNIAIQDWITNEAKIKPDLYVAAGSTQGEFASSIAVAQAYDSQTATVVHGGAKKIDIGGRSFKEYDSIYKAAVMLGREAGMEPQIPLTFKNIGIEGELHQLSDKEASLGLNEGVLMSRLDNGSFEIIKGVNTLQNNTFLVNPDGTTHSKQLARIIRQLNKEITVNAKQQLLKKPNGSNRNTVSPEDVKAWLEGYLSSKIANTQDDNLILSFRAITVVATGDRYDITYAFVPNFEVSFLVFTGTIIDPSN